MRVQASLASACLALALLVGVAPPATARDWEVSIPFDYQRLSYDGVVAQGARVPLLWFGGPFGKRLRFATSLGADYMRDGNGVAYSYASAMGTLDFVFDLDIVAPYVGVLGHYSFPFSQPLVGSPYGWAPRLGLAFDLGELGLDLWAAYGQVQGLSRPDGSPVDATRLSVGLQANLSF